MKISHRRFLWAMMVVGGFGVLLSGWELQIVGAQLTPLTYPEINTALHTRIPNAQFKSKAQMLDYMIARIEQRKVDKPLTADREDDLRQAGATDALIAAIRRNSPALKPTPTPVPASTPTPKVNSSSNSNTGTRQGISDSLGKIIGGIANNGNSRNALGMEFVYIQGGTFMMGGDADFFKKQPVHQVTISKGFYMGKTEVTQGQWKAVMGYNPANFKECGDNCPIENVSWDDTQEFIRKINMRGDGTYRLPTEAEWEYAARAGSNSKYGFGSDEESLKEYAWFSWNSTQQTHPVASKKPNDWGLYDMQGNVWEWCNDWYEKYSDKSLIDPTGAASGTNRVYRGGSWMSNTDEMPIRFRQQWLPSIKQDTHGFRLIRQ